MKTTTYMTMLAVALFSAAGFAAAADMSGSGISVELAKSPYVTLSNVQTISEDDGSITLHGRVQRDRTPFVGGGFVDATLFSQDGSILETVRSNHIPRGSRKERQYLSRYNVSLKRIPVGSHVRLTYNRTH